MVKSVQSYNKNPVTAEQGVLFIQTINTGSIYRIPSPAQSEQNIENDMMHSEICVAAVNIVKRMTNPSI